MSKVDPPGVAIQDFLKRHGLSAEDLAAEVPCSPLLMNAIVYENHSIFPMMAKKLAGLIENTTEQYWLDLDKSYRDHLEFLDSNGLGHRYDELG